MQIIGCSTLAYAGQTLDVALDGIAGAGYDWVELATMPGFCDHLADGGSLPSAAAIERRLRDRGLRACSLSAHLHLIPAEPGHLPSYGPERALEELRARIELAAALGAPVVNTSAGEPRSDGARALLVSQLLEAGAYARDAGVTLALETAGGTTANAAESARLLAPLEGLPIAINFDTGNLRFYSALDPVQELPAFAGRLAHVHLKDHIGGRGDYVFPALGEGEIDLGAIVGTLHDLDYTGPVTVEVEFSDPVQRPPVAEIDAAVRTSLAFLEEVVRAGA
jgi:L-ribulose-5-phosphate 3-epimerase